MSITNKLLEAAGVALDRAIMPIVGKLGPVHIRPHGYTAELAPVVPLRDLRTLRTDTHEVVTLDALAKLLEIHPAWRLGGVTISKSADAPELQVGVIDHANPQNGKVSASIPLSVSAIALLKLCSWSEYSALAGLVISRDVEMDAKERGCITRLRQAKTLEVDTSHGGTRINATWGAQGAEAAPFPSEFRCVIPLLDGASGPNGLTKGGAPVGIPFALSAQIDLAEGNGPAPKVRLRISRERLEDLMSEQAANVVSAGLGITAVPGAIRSARFEEDV